MNRVNLREQFANFLLLLVQLPLLYRVVLFDRAFAFFYISFLLFLPYGLGRIYLLLISCLSGFLVDVFSNTPGVHAFACVTVSYLRNGCMAVVYDEVEDLININHITLGNLSFTFYVFPLVLVHHTLIFVIENGGFHLLGLLITKILLSSFFSFIIIFILNYLIAPKAVKS